MYESTFQAQPRTQSMTYVWSGGECTWTGRQERSTVSRR